MALTVHTALSNLDKGNAYVRMLFIDYSSAFNTIVPAKLVLKLRSLRLNTSLCNWILTGRPQVVNEENGQSHFLCSDPGQYRGSPSGLRTQSTPLHV